MVGYKEKSPRRSDVVHLSKATGWSVYIIQSKTDGRLYTGISTDPKHRLEEHNHGCRGAKSTRRGRPWELVYTRAAETKSEALRREAAIKRLPRSKKLELLKRPWQTSSVSSWNPLEEKPST